MNIVSENLVLGMGASGEAAARLLLREGRRVTLVDLNDTEELRERAVRWREEGVRVHLGCSTVPWGDYELAVVSPGIPDSDPWIQSLRESGTRVISELELGWSRRTCPVIAVTGSNGKSTVVKALCHVLNRSGLVARAAGNYGPPLSAEIEHEADWLVVEASSFQLELVDEFRPEVGILLNLQPNHLDRHGDMETYGELKSRLFRRSAGDDLCLVHEDLFGRVAEWSRGKGHWRTFGSSVSADIRYIDGHVRKGDAPWVDIQGSYFDNPVLGPAMAAILAAVEVAGVEALPAARHLQSFKPLPHRMQKVGEKNGVTYIDDSKATSLSAMMAAIRMTHGKVRLIAGGAAKEADFSIALPLLEERGVSAYLIGRDAKAMAEAWGDRIECVVGGAMEEAFGQAVVASHPGDTILLSPGCASFDQYTSFDERGDHFAWLSRLATGQGRESLTDYKPKQIDNRTSSGTIRNLFTT